MAFMSHLNHAISQPCNFLEAGVNQISKIRKWWIHFLGRNVAYWRVTYIYICLKSHICTVWAYLILWMYRMLYGYIKLCYHVLSELLFNRSIYIYLFWTTTMVLSGLPIFTTKVPSIPNVIWQPLAQSLEDTTHLKIDPFHQTSPCPDMIYILYIYAYL